jgi:acetyl-CoA C-acetyltransferase
MPESVRAYDMVGSVRSGWGAMHLARASGRPTLVVMSGAATEALGSIDVPLDEIDAFWLGTMASGISGLTLSRPLKIDYRPVSRLENMCATFSEAFRNACYAVASGAYDLVMAIGVEKLKDSGFSGLAVSGLPGSGTEAALTAPALFSLLAPAYAKKYGVDETEMKDVLTRSHGRTTRTGR